MRPALLRWTVLPILATLAVASTRASQSSPRVSTIQGRTINALTREPVRGAVVRANLERDSGSTAPPEIEFLTDSNGRFVLNDLTPGTYGLIANKTGYADAVSDRFEVAAGESKRGLEIALMPEAVISGRVSDAAGEPVARISVRAIAPDGHRRSATTDQEGRYSIGGLAAGAYVVGVVAQASVSGEVYFSGAAKPDDATPITVKLAEEHAGVDLTVRVAALQQPLPRAGAGETASVRGIVKDPDGVAQRRVMVVLTNSDLAVRSVRGYVRTTITDTEGRFRFDNVPPGRVLLIAGRSTAVGQISEELSGTRIDLAPGQSIADVLVTMSRPVTLSGVVRDHLGDPVTATVVVSTTSLTGPVSAAAVTADSQGRYSAYGLQPGEYVVSANRVSAGDNLRMFDETGLERTVAFSPIYYPGVADIGLAAPLRITDRDISGFDLVVRPVPATTIDAIVDAGNRALGNVKLSMSSLDRLKFRSSTTSAPTDLTPVVLQGVSAGQYLLTASGYEFGEDGSRTQTFWARQRVTTDGLAPQTVRLLLEPAPRVSGRIVFEGAAPRPVRIGVGLQQVADDGQAAFSTDVSLGPGSVTFTVESLVPGRFVINAGAFVAGSNLPGQSWILKSVVTQGRDVLDLPIDLAAGSTLSDVVLTFIDRPSATEVAGVLTDMSGRPIREGAVVLFAADPQYWHETSQHVRIAVADAQGRYTVTGLPPGNYRAASLSTSQNRNVLPMLTTLLPTAVAFTLRDGEHRVVDVRQVK